MSTYFYLDDGSPTIDEDELAKEISKRTGIELSTVLKVLETEDKLLETVGLMYE